MEVTLKLFCNCMSKTGHVGSKPAEDRGSTHGLEGEVCGGVKGLVGMGGGNKW